MDRKKNIPHIRFQNYEDEWVYSTIGRHISLLNGRAYKQEELLDEGKYRVLRVGNFNTNSKWYYSNLELEDNKYVNKGDLLYLWATNFGPEIWTEEKAIYHYHIWKLEFDKTDINQDYLYIWLESDKNKIQQNTNGSTMVHITKNMMEERRISLPSQEEQSAIGSLFRTLDDLLASYKDNLANYQSLKATMLSKMFPKAGQTVPEIRLDGFEDEWEIRKLSEISEVYDGTHETPNYTESGVQFLSVENISTLESEKYISEEDFERDFRVSPEFGDILMTRIGSIGVPNIVTTNEKIAFYVSLALLKPKKRTNSLFVKSSIESNPFQEELWKKTLHIAFPKKINKNEISQSTIKCPSYEEQSAIGIYFSNLDNLITAHQEKISQLETLKKKLLQDMFI